MMNIKGHKKGQVTFINLIGVLVTLIVYFTVVLPILNPLITYTDSYLTNTSNTTNNKFLDVQIIMLYSIPFFLLISIILSALNYAVPVRSYSKKKERL